MIVWLNGTFGVGKTTTARRICDDGTRRLFDPEFVGYMLSAQLRDIPADDFQDLPPWRALVPVVAKQVHDFTGSDLVAVQTVLDESYWDELAAGIASYGLPMIHVLLDCDEQEVRNRIEHDEEEASARQWRLDHLATFARSRSWMRSAADLVVDTTDLTMEQVAGSIVDHLDGLRTSPS